MNQPYVYGGAAVMLVGSLVGLILILQHDSASFRVSPAQRAVPAAPAMGL